MMNVLRFCTSLLACASALAAAADIEVSVNPLDIAVDRGSSADVVFTFVNTTSSESAVMSLQSAVDLTPGYSYALVDSPGCGPLTELSDALGRTRFALTIDPVPASASRSCTLRLSRSATAIDNAFLFW